MARKSRRITQEQIAVPQVVVMEEKTPLRTAIYARLSVDKGEDNDSIPGQIELCRQFVAQHPELTVVDTYEDKGFSGTNFSRPDFTRLMENVRNGTIQCIVVKDLSRFGRNFLETGYYLENLLVHLNVRFIAVNDDFDSTRKSDRESLAVPIKNLINEMYAKDFSKKLTSYYEMSSQQGTRIIERSTYGYILDKEHNTLIPNPATAPIVQMIFRWYISGLTHGEIAGRLNTLSVLTPAAYKATFEEHKEIPQGDSWNIARVRSILCNQAYCGDTVHGKRRKILYKGIEAHKTSPEEWIIHRNTHEAIVLRADYEQAEVIRNERAEQYWQYRAGQAERRETSCDVFPQKVFCKDCGETMHFLRYSIGNMHDEQYGSHYQCFRSADSGKKKCLQTINADYLKAVVMEQIRNLLRTMGEAKEIVKAAQRDANGKTELGGIQAKIRHLQYRINENSKISATLYENYASGILDGEYKELKEHYALEKQRLHEELAVLQNRQREIEQTIARFFELLEQYTAYAGDETLDERLIAGLIERIDVSAGGNLEIHFTCDDIYAKILELTEETRP